MAVSFASEPPVTKNTWFRSAGACAKIGPMLSQERGKKEGQKDGVEMSPEMEDNLEYLGRDLLGEGGRGGCDRGEGRVERQLGHLLGHFRRKDERKNRRKCGYWEIYEQC